MAFTLQIQCPTLEDAERIIETLRASAAPAENLPTADIGDFSSSDEPEWMGTARRALRAVQEKYGANDMTKPLEVLGRFGAGRISELRPRDVPAFVAACRWCGTPDRTDQGVTMP